jgi:hypothetical protein
MKRILALMYLVVFTQGAYSMGAGVVCPNSEFVEGNFREVLMYKRVCGKCIPSQWFRFETADRQHGCDGVQREELLHMSRIYNFVEHTVNGQCYPFRSGDNWKQFTTFSKCTACTFCKTEDDGNVSTFRHYAEYEGTSVFVGPQNGPARFVQATTLFPHSTSNDWIVYYSKCEPNFPMRDDRIRREVAIYPVCSNRTLDIDYKLLKESYGWDPKTCVQWGENEELTYDPEWPAVNFSTDRTPAGGCGGTTGAYTTPAIESDENSSGSDSPAEVYTPTSASSASSNSNGSTSSSN